MPVGRKSHYVSFIQVPGTVLFSSMLMNQYSMLNKVSLYGNTHLAKLYTNPLTKMLLLEALRNPALYFPQEQWLSIC